MSEEFGSDFVTIVDDDGQEFELEARTWTRTTRTTGSSFCA